VHGAGAGKIIYGASYTFLYTKLYVHIVLFKYIIKVNKYIYEFIYIAYLHLVKLYLVG
jgi:hypothetical protein